MILAVVGHVEGFEFDAATEADADVEAGEGVMEGGILIDGCAPVAAPAPTPGGAGLRPAPANGIIGSGDAIWPTACGSAEAGGGPYPDIEPETALAAAMMAEAADAALGS